MVHTKRERKKGKGKDKGQQQAQSSAHFSFDTIHGLKLKEVEYKVPSSAERKARRAEFQGTNGQEGVRSKFLKMLANEHEQELRDKLGLTDAEIDRMKKGKSVNGYNVHHKLPIHGGGKNEFSNFILTPLYPHDQWHHDVLDKQLGIGSGKVLLPWTDEMIYDPKQYGFTKNNEKVQPNYVSRVKAEKYPKIYTAEQVADAAARKRELAKFSQPQPSKKEAAAKRITAFLAKQKSY
jgi:hypothetical protein